ncbi:hypothetical protein ASZ90_007774 [hydrocarbon metagenome]|uniref:Uncharacterized protein n=1 Tax=hydrocarbon metagenome TaxID=938273 RepID=A0A0W8FNH7_9ZZZZ
MKNKYGDRLIRCPKLGDEMTFSYCLREAGDLPCARIIRCWSPFFDIESFLKEKMSPEKWDSFAHSKPRDKVTNLIELIEAAKAKK